MAWPWAAAETYLGLVEVGVGLIPAGGGVKELVLRATEGAAPGGDLFARIRKVSETIATAKVSTSAFAARELGFLRDTDPLTMNRERLIEDAKQTALAMVHEGYVAPHRRTDIPVLGEARRRGGAWHGPGRRLRSNHARRPGAGGG